MHPDVAARIVDRARAMWAAGGPLAAVHQGMSEMAQAHAEAVFLAHAAAGFASNRADCRALRTKLCREGSLDVGRWVREELVENLHDELFPQEIEAAARAAVRAYRGRIKTLFAGSHAIGVA